MRPLRVKRTTVRLEIMATQIVAAFKPLQRLPQLAIQIGLPSCPQRYNVLAVRLCRRNPTLLLDAIADLLHFRIQPIEMR